MVTTPAESKDFADVFQDRLMIPCLQVPLTVGINVGNSACVDFFLTKERYLEKF